MALPPKRPGKPASADLAERRAGLAGAIVAGYGRTDPPAVEQRIGGVRVLRFDPPAAPRGRILHLHGGAYRIGAPETVATYAAALARDSGFTVYCPAYRLAPEHPFPAGLVDALAVLDVLRGQDDGPFLLAGDSAGGGLAAALTAFAVARGDPPDGLVLLSAWLDLTISSPCYAAHEATDPLFSREAAQTAADLYLQGLAPEEPLASPLLGSVEGFPPTLVNVGTGEVLTGDSRAFHARLEEAGVAAQLQAIAGMDHVAVTRGLDLPGSAETFAAILAFIDRIAART